MLILQDNLGLPDSVQALLVELKRKQLIDYNILQQISYMSITDIHEYERQFIYLGSGDRSKSYHFAKLCIQGPLGQYGTKLLLRTVALTILDLLLEQDSADSRSAILKVLLILPKIHFGYNHDGNPDAVVDAW